MKKTFCDVCGKETKNVNQINIPCHLYSHSASLGYVDSDMNRVSGRVDILDMCNACNNRVYAAAVEQIRLLKE